ncbi:hypothetical protein ACA910_019338 [Epithemia clementina (nom. ined.)]
MERHSDHDGDESLDDAQDKGEEHNEQDEAEDKKMDNGDSFQEVIAGLTARNSMKQRRDPRALRLAAVTAAVVDLASTSSAVAEKDQEDDEDDDTDNDNQQNKARRQSNVSASQVYAKAMTALEGTLTSSQKKMPPSSSSGNSDRMNGNDDEEDHALAIVDCWATQVALLELLTVTVPHVQPVGILQATLPLFSRVLRAVVATTQETQQSLTGGGILTDTRDELGGANAVLRGSCRAVAQFLQRVTVATPSNNAASAQAMVQLYMGTLVRLWDDARPKVRKAAQTAALQVLLLNTTTTPSSSSSHHRDLVRATSQYFNSMLTKAKSEMEETMDGRGSKSIGKHASSSSSSSTLLHGLAMLEQCLVRLDFDTLSKNAMELLTVLFQVDAAMAAAASSSSEYVTTKIHKIHHLSSQQHHGFLLQSILSVITKALDPDEEDDEQEEVETDNLQDSQAAAIAKIPNMNKKHHPTLQIKIEEWSGRVLASLLTAQPAVLFRSGSAPDEVLERGRSLYGHAVLAAMRRVMEGQLRKNNRNSTSNNNTNNLAYRLLPLVIQMVLLLSKPVARNFHIEDDEDDDSEGASIGNALLVDLTQLFRSAPFQQLLATGKNIGKEQSEQQLLLLERCTKDSIKGLNAVFRPEYKPCWAVGLKALVVFLQKVVEAASIAGDAVPDEVSASVELLLYQRNQVPPNSPPQRSIEDAFSTLVQGIGIQATWPLISWNASSSSSSNTGKTKNLNDNDTTSLGISLDRAWVLSTMRSAALTAQPNLPRLAFFNERVLVVARQEDRLAATTTETKSKASAKSRLHHQTCVVSLWSLLPCFCKAPGDIALALPALATVLSKALEDSRYPRLASIICRSLSVLCSDSPTSNISSNGEEKQDATAAALSSASQKLLPVLFKLIASSSSTTHKSKAAASKDDSNMDVDKPSEESPKEETASDVGQQTQALSEAIASLARHAPPKFLHGLFKKLMHKLLDEVQSETRDENRICSFLCLSQALVASETLDESNISFLYRTLKPFIRSKDGVQGARCQKRAYKVLAEMCERNHSYLLVDVGRLNEMTELLTGSDSASSQVAARHMRMKCLNHIVEGTDVSLLPEILQNPQVIAETLLSLKDTNAKTREAAYQLLLSMASRQRRQLDQFLSIITAALGAETPHMRSAAVMALSRIVYQFAWDDENAVYVQSLLPSLLSTILVLMNENSREVMKSAIGFVRISVAAMQREQMEPLLPDLVGSVLGFHKTKSRFRSKIKIILKKLVKQFGYDLLMPHVPESETRLLVHMRKLDERQKRKKEASKLKGEGEDTPNQGTFDAMLESDEEDSDDGRTFTTGTTGFSKMTGRSSAKTSKSEALKSGESRSKAGTATTTNSKNKKKHGSKGVQLPDETDGEVVDMLGASMSKRVKFADDDDYDSDDDSDGVMEFDDEGRLIVHDEDTTQRASFANNEHAIKKQRTTKLGDAKKVSPRNQKTKNPPDKHQLGAAYKSKKAGGDVTRKNQTYEPYAFVPLNGKSYSRKNRRAAVEHMSSVVRKGKKRKQK